MFFCCDVIGLEAAITDYKGNAIALKNAKIVVESEDENLIQVMLYLCELVVAFVTFLAAPWD